VSGPARRRRLGLGLGLGAFALAAACSGGGTPPPKSGGGVGNTAGSGDPPVGVAKDTRTELERRRDAACGQVGPKLAQCAALDSRAKLDRGELTQKEFAQATKPDVVRALGEDFRKKCRGGYMSSRQVRVLEVCFREEPQCGPLEACLENLKAMK
jgi:hypothetical protein